MRVLINLVGKQQQPNTLATLHVRPDAIVQVCKGDDYLPQIDHFETHCHETLGVSRFFILKLRLQSFAMAQSEEDALMRRITRWQRELHAQKVAAGALAADAEEPVEILVNLTGGTKLMAVALQQLALKNGHRCLYVDDKAILDSENGRFPLPDMTLSDLIGPMGYVFRSEAPDLSASDVGALWAIHQSDPRGYGLFCEWIRINEVGLTVFDCTPRWDKALMERLCAAGFLTCTPTETQDRYDIVFLRPEVLGVLRLHGLVLELALLQVMVQVQARLEAPLRLYPNVKIRHRTSPDNGFTDESEFDLVAVCEGRVFFFECKITPKGEKVAQMLDGFLTNTARYGGASANRILVRPHPYRDRNLEVKADNRRIQLLGIGDLQDEGLLQRLMRYMLKPDRGMV